MSTTKHILSTETTSHLNLLLSVVILVFIIVSFMVSLDYRSDKTTVQADRKVYIALLKQAYIKEQKDFWDKHFESCRQNQFCSVALPPQSVFALELEKLGAEVPKVTD